MNSVSGDLHDSVSRNKRFAISQTLGWCHSLNTRWDGRIKSEGLIDAGTEIFELGESCETGDVKLFVIAVNFLLQLLDNIRTSGEFEEKAC